MCRMLTSDIINVIVSKRTKIIWNLKRPFSWNKAIKEKEVFRMKTYEEYEREYEQIRKSAKPQEYVAKKELWIGFTVCEDENRVPEPTDDFMSWLESLDERLFDCVAETIKLANSLRGL